MCAYSTQDFPMNQNEREKLKLVFARRLIARRGRRGLSQQDLVQRMKQAGGNISLKQVWNWEARKHLPQGRQLRLLCDVLGTTGEQLFGEDAAEDRTIREKCHQHIDKLIDGLGGNAELLAWTYVELRNKFPLDRPTTGEIAAVESQVMDEADKATGSFDAHSAEEPGRVSLNAQLRPSVSRATIAQRGPSKQGSGKQSS